MAETNMSAGAEVEAVLMVDDLALRLQCSCGRTIHIADLDLGRHLRCADCGTTWVVRFLVGTVQQDSSGAPA